ncbi:platelet glycoprotein Ib alpha chain-like, partial [Penaeus japonicus]|uniref:platelet glycoprotein Ib alpha chain-like n=1 Tax=Penaeus japonicus TaxID=27405 RepID=UPI001C70FF3C
SSSSSAWQPLLPLTAGNPLSPTSQVKQNTTSTGLSNTTTPATTSATRKPVTATTPRDPTTCSSPTAACRPSDTSWTVTTDTWPKSTTTERPVTLIHTSQMSRSRSFNCQEMTQRQRYPLFFNYMCKYA